MVERNEKREEKIYLKLLNRKLFSCTLKIDDLEMFANRKKTGDEEEKGDKSHDIEQ